MGKRRIKKLLALLMIITILAADFFVLGSNLITYAVQIVSATDNPNIEFSAYFKDGKTRVDSINSSIKNENLKLYAEIKVNGDDGYLVEGTTIEILNSNFNVTSSNKGTVEGNKVVLSQVSAGETVEVELDIAPIIANKVTADMLSQTSTIKLDGTYKYSQAEEGEAITASRTVSVNYQPDETATAELTTDIITNKVLSVNGENKRIVQLLIKSRLTDNQYPVENTKLTVNVPQIGEVVPTVSVIALGELATNGTAEISDIQNTNGTLTITLNNGADGNQLVNWNKNAYDELVVTFEYISTVDVSAVQLTTTSEIKLYNVETPKTQTQTKTVGNDELNQVVIGRTEITTEELYKGQLYENITATEKVNVQYKTITTLGITNTGVADQITIHEGADVFATDNGELAINTKYVSTEINKAKMLEILGNNVNIQIKNGGIVIDTITKDSNANEEGNIVLTYTTNSSELDIVITGQPAKTGILEINHVKQIMTNQSYDRTDLQRVKTLKSKNTTSATLAGAQIVTNSAENGALELKETVTRAELVVENDKETWSTTDTNAVTLGITLVTDGVQYDLYKNPKITLQMPSAVESVVVNGVDTLYDDGFGNPVVNIDQDKKIIEISLEGAQTAYPESSATQLYLQLNLNITLSKLAANQVDNITMTYTNDNASQYYGGSTDVGIVQQPIGISAPSGLVKMFNLASNGNTSTTQQLKQQITGEDAGKELNFETILINNTDSDMNNVRILGQLPTTGIGTNTLETALKSIIATNGTIYYTENINATSDTENTSNGWTTELLANAKLYLIKLDKINKGSNYTARVNIQIPNVIEKDLESYTKYEVIYDSQEETDTKESSREIGLVTYVISNLETDLTAQVGQEKLKNGDTVKEGEVIRYTASVKNNTSKTLENIELKAEVPEGTVVVEPAENYEYLLSSYYVEKTDIKEISITIPTLPAGQTYTTQYEVRVNTNITTGTEISNVVKAIYNNTETNSEEIINKLEESNIRVTIKKADDKSVELVAGSSTKYNIIVENLSNKKIKDLQMQIVSNAFVTERVTQDTGDYISLYGDAIPEKIAIDEISANGYVVFSLIGTIKENVDRLDTSINVIDTNGTIYKSNTATENLPYTNATISLTSPQDNAYLKEGDTVEYNFTITNTGNITENVVFEDIISYYLQVQSISVNREVMTQITDETDVETYMPRIENDILHRMLLQPGESTTIDITAKVKYMPSKAKTITNTADVSVMGVYKATSQEVTHILTFDSTSIENLKNIINGSVWFDANVNGQKDSGEDTLGGIIVKLYDTSTNSYLVDEEGSVITITTDADGEYTFTKISNGSYMLVFIYDMQKYEPTTYLAESVDTTINSKVLLKNITVNGEVITIAGTDEINVQDNIENINMGLKEKKAIPSVEDTKRTITGQSWLDVNKNGQKDDGEKLLSGIKVKLYDVSTNNYLKDRNGNIIETITNNNGEYYFTNVEKGSYIVIFEFDTEKYDLATYLAEGVDTTRSSKVILKKMTINGSEIEVASTDLIELQENVNDINIGLKEKEGMLPEDTNPNEGKVDKMVISGLAWLDKNRNGQKDAEETVLPKIRVRLYDVSTKNYLKDATTDANGKYIFDNIEKGSYILVFEYDTEEYEPTTYLAEGVDTTQNSKVVLKKININGQEITAAVTDTINVQTNILNINIGLKEKLIYDLELSKSISRIVVQTSKETKAYDYEDKTFAKVEIHRKQIEGSLVVLEYTIKVKNNGEMTGYAKNIVDYLPNGLTFSSELNTDWYLSGSYLYTKSLENVEINPGEEKEIKLILTKTMTAENTGLVNNRAEIYQDYNQYGDYDIDSTPNNQIQDEDDYGAADVIILVSTGGGSTALYYILLMINMILIGIAIKLMIKNRIIRRPTKKGRR